MNKLTSLSVLLVPSLLFLAAAAGGCGSDDKGSWCDVCSLPSLTCTAGTQTGTASLGSPSTTGCSGTLTSSDGTDSLWIHCDTKQICVEHVSECFPATTTPTSFSYTIASKGLTVTCTAN